MITAEKKKKNKFLPNFEKQSIYSLRYDEMQNWLIEHGQQKFRAKQIFEWLYQKRVDSIDEMTNLSKTLREKISEEYTINPVSVDLLQKSTDGTIKNGVNPIVRFGVVRSPQSTESSSSTQCVLDSLRDRTNLGLMPLMIRPFARSTWPLVYG